MNAVTRSVYAIFSLAMGLSLLALGNSSAVATTVSFDPSHPTLLATETVEVDVVVDAGVMDVHCFRVQIDSVLTTIHLIDVTEGPLLQQAGNTFFFWESENGVYDVFNCLLGPGLVVDGPGVLATLTFAAGDAPCTTPLQFSLVLFQNDNLDPIAVGGDDGAFEVAGCSSCSCDCHSDPECDGVTNVLDVVRIVNVAFRGSPPLPEAGCDYDMTDVDCDGITNVIDVVRVVNVAFRGALPQDQFCVPCAVGVPSK